MQISDVTALTQSNFSVQDLKSAALLKKISALHVCSFIYVQNTYLVQQVAQEQHIAVPIKPYDCKTSMIKTKVPLVELSPPWRWCLLSWLQLLQGCLRLQTNQKGRKQQGQNTAAEVRWYRWTPFQLYAQLDLHYQENNKYIKKTLLQRRWMKSRNFDVKYDAIDVFGWFKQGTFASGVLHINGQVQAVNRWVNARVTERSVLYFQKPKVINKWNR